MHVVCGTVRIRHGMILERAVFVVSAASGTFAIGGVGSGDAQAPPPAKPRATSLSHIVTPHLCGPLLRPYMKPGQYILTFDIIPSWIAQFASPKHSYTDLEIAKDRTRVVSTPDAKWQSCNRKTTTRSRPAKHGTTRAVPTTPRLYVDQ